MDAADKSTMFFPDAPAADLASAKIVVIPVPFDQTSTWVKGADRGPTAILEASGHLEDLDLETGTAVYRQGIYTDVPVTHWADPPSMVAAVRRRVQGHLAHKKFCVVLGGEHSVTLGSVEAHAGYEGGLSVLQLDAHSDLRESYHGSPYNHACVMAHVEAICPIVQVGVRAMSQEEYDSADHSRLFLAHELNDRQAWVEAVVAKLRSPVYVTFDLDVLDPSIMPSTGTPEPGGLLWQDVLTLLRRVSEMHRIVGFDVVELCPQPTNKAPDFLAAKLIYKLLSYIDSSGNVI